MISSSPPKELILQKIPQRNVQIGQPDNDVNDFV